MKNKLFVEIREPVRIKPAVCIGCGKRIDSMCGLQARQPNEGDFSVCIGCGTLMKYTADQSLCAASAEDMAAFKQSSPEEYELAEELRLMFRAKRAQREN